MKKILPNQQRVWVAALALAPSVWLTYPLIDTLQRQLGQSIVEVIGTNSLQSQALMAEKSRILSLVAWATLLWTVLAGALWVRWYQRAYRNLCYTEPNRPSFTLEWPWEIPFRWWKPVLGGALVIWGLAVALGALSQLGNLLDQYLKIDTDPTVYRSWSLRWAESTHYWQIALLLVVWAGMALVSAAERRLKRANNSF